MERFGRPWLWLFTCLTLVSLFQLMQCAADGESWQIFIVSFFFYVRPFWRIGATFGGNQRGNYNWIFLLLFFINKKMGKIFMNERKEMKRNWIGSIDWRVKTSLPDIQHLFPSCLSVSPLDDDDDDGRFVSFLPSFHKSFPGHCFYFLKGWG